MFLSAAFDSIRGCGESIYLPRCHAPPVMDGGCTLTLTPKGEAVPRTYPRPPATVSGLDSCSASLLYSLRMHTFHRSFLFLRICLRSSVDAGSPPSDAARPDTQLCRLLSSRGTLGILVGRWIHAKLLSSIKRSPLLDPGIMEILSRQKGRAESIKSANFVCIPLKRRMIARFRGVCVDEYDLLQGYSLSISDCVQ